MNDDVQMIPIDHIRIINPRLRNKAKFELIVDSIKKLGLKKPIQVSRRAADEGGEQGRAFAAEFGGECGPSISRASGLVA